MWLTNTGNVRIMQRRGAFAKSLLPRKGSITYSECVCSLSYLAYKAHAPYYIVIYAGMAVPYFSTLSHKRNDFRGEGVTEHKMY